MTKQEIIDLAKEYDLIAGEHGITLMGIVNFATLIANYEREKILEITDYYDWVPQISAKIRLRANNE